MADDNKPITGKEKRERQMIPEPENELAELQRQIEQPEHEQGIREMRDAAIEIGKNPDIPYAAGMMEMKPEISPEKDPEAMTFLYAQILALLTKIANQNPDLDLKTLTPENLAPAAQRLSMQQGKQKLLLERSESLALTKLQEILMSPASPAALQVARDWPYMITRAEENREGFGTKYLKRLKEKPAETIALTVAGAAGVYVGYHMLKWLFSKGWENTKKKISDKWDSAFSFRNILGVLGVVSLGAYFGRNKIENWLYETFGFRFGKKTIKDMARELKEGKMPQPIIDAGKQVEAAKVAAKAKGEEIKEQAKEAKDVYKEHAAFSKFITEQNPTLTVRALLFSRIGNESYEMFMQASEKDRKKILYDLYMKLGGKQKKSITEMGEEDLRDILGLVTEYGVADLHEFFSDMLKKPDHPDFKNKTINEVMALICAGKDKYIDPEKTKAAKEAAASPESVQAVGRLIDKIAEDPKIVTDKNFRHEFEMALAKAGLVLLVNEVGTATIVTAKNWVPIATFVGDEVNGALQYMGDVLIREGGVAGTAIGAYLKGAGYVAWIGVPGGMTLGIIEGFLKRPYSPLSWGYHGLKGGIKGLGKSMAYPYHVMEMVGKYWSSHITPLDLAREAYYRKVFAVEEFRNISGVRRIAETGIGQRLGLESLIKRATEGRMEITGSLMKRLTIYRQLLEKERSLLKNSEQIAHYQKLSGKIDRFIDQNGWIDNRFDKKFWADKIAKAVPDRKTAVLLEDNPRLARMMLNETHPLRTLAGKPGENSFRYTVEFLANDKKLLEKFAKNPLLAQDHRIIAMVRGEAEVTAEGFAKLVAERVKTWGKFSGNELRLFESQPAVVFRYTELADQLADLKKAAKLKTPGAAEALNRAKALRAMLLKPNSAHAKFTYENLRHMDSLFHDAKAFDYFMAIDRQILNGMKPLDRLNLAEKFADFTKNEKAIHDLVLKTESRLGIVGRTSQRLSRIKAGAYEKIEETFEKTVEKTRETFRGMRAVRLGQGQLEALAKTGNAAEAQKLLEKSGVKLEQWGYELIANCKNADEVRYVLRSAPKTSGSRYIKFIEPLAKTSQVLKYLKPAGQATLGAAFFLGAGIDYYHAATTENERKRNVYLEKAGIETVAGAIDLGMLAGGAGLGTTAAYTFAAAPYLYMLEAGYESSLEAKDTEKEWLAKYDHETLIHHWISTGKEFSAGESYRITLTTTTLEDVEREHRETRKKIVTALLLQEGERFENEGKIRLAYIEKTCRFMTAADYEKARNILHDSRLFAGIMADRQMALAQRVSALDIGGINIVEEKYSPEKIDAATMKNLVTSYAKETLSARVHPVLGRQFDAMETGDLVAFLWELDKYMANPENAKSILQNEKDFRDQLRDYLFYARKTDTAKILQEKYLREADRMILAKQKALPENPESLAKARREAIAEIVKSGDKTFLSASIENFENGEGALPENLAKQITDTDACFALHRLASFFGYAGRQNEEDLKRFLNSTHKSVFGVYWDGKAWALNEAGWEFADEIGPRLDRAAVEKIIQKLREQPDNILEHRQEAITYSMSDIFKGQVLRMADILEQGLKEYRPRKKQRQKPIAPPAPAVAEKMPEPEAVAEAA
ncbi:hypothetical protein JXA05_03515 [Candidatus Peregrinibacteria bacterium]|nr:hypothetical protein [Candidatus Peregrinibacteria bacterium]